MVGRRGEDIPLVKCVQRDNQVNLVLPAQLREYVLGDGAGVFGQDLV